MWVQIKLGISQSLRQVSSLPDTAKVLLRLLNATEVTEPAKNDNNQRSTRLESGDVYL